MVRRKREEWWTNERNRQSEFRGRRRRQAVFGPGSGADVRFSRDMQEAGAGCRGRRQRLDCLDDLDILVGC